MPDHHFTAGGIAKRRQEVVMAGLAEVVEPCGRLNHNPLKLVPRQRWLREHAGRPPAGRAGQAAAAS